MEKTKETENEMEGSSAEIKKLKHRVLELEQTLNSIQSGEVDALVINDKRGEASVYTLEGADQPYRLLVESMSEGAITLTEEGKIIHCNKRFSEMVKMPTAKIIGASFFTYIPKLEHDALRYLLDKGRLESCKGEFTLEATNSSIKTVLLSCHHLEFGNISGISMVATDISELNKMQQEMAISLKEKEVMLKEIYHRVKNNLQVISSLLNLQARTIKDPTSRKIFIESSTRLKAMALVHEMLYQSGNLAQIEMGKYVRSLSKNLAEIYNVDSRRVKLIIDADSILLSIENALPYGLVINELISNAFKHAFPAEKSGEIRVSIKNKEDSIILIVKDNGIGFPSDIDFNNTTTLGVQLIHTLTKQLGGNIVLESSASGTTFTLNFSSKSKEE